MDTAYTNLQPYENSFGDLAKCSETPTQVMKPKIKISSSSRNRQDYVYVKGEYKSTLQKIKHCLKCGNKVKNMVLRNFETS